ncbi:MAG: phosphoadenosine phosphosulfate reductase family protein, partial [Desulfovibrio sp.]|nr:phosphoadenosine phosphosulfate reductase family protein [Desulfovibrio sp.]
LDAGGRVPAPKNARESAWAKIVDSGELKRSMDKLNERRRMPLEQKIELSIERIREWYEAWDGAVAVSYSGGKDSSVLLWLVRTVYPDVRGVFCHTGLEYPEVIRTVMATPNCQVIRPKLRFREVINKYGWPIASKKLARGINILRHPTDRNQNIYRLYDQGVNRFGQPVNGRKVSGCRRFLVDAPFEVSDHCCEVMKKEPMRRYRRETGRVPFVGILATYSKERELTYLKTGSCNAFDAKEPKSAPLAFWTDQDVLECIRKNNIPLASVYGEIVERDGQLCATGLRRTGCVFCAFGLHMDLNDGPETRFEMLKRTHPKLWVYVMEIWGWRKCCAIAAKIRLCPHWRKDCGGEKTRIPPRPPASRIIYQFPGIGMVKIDALKILEYQLDVNFEYDSFLNGIDKLAASGMIVIRMNLRPDLAIFVSFDSRSCEYLHKALDSYLDKLDQEYS